MISHFYRHFKVAQQPLLPRAKLTQMRTTLGIKLKQDAVGSPVYNYPFPLMIIMIGRTRSVWTTFAAATSNGRKGRPKCNSRNPQNRIDSIS